MAWGRGAETGSEDKPHFSAPGAPWSLRAEGHGCSRASGERHCPISKDGRSLRMTAPNMEWGREPSYTSGAEGRDGAGQGRPWVTEQVPMQRDDTAQGTVVFRAEEPEAGTMAPLKSWGAGWGADWARPIPS